MLTVAFTPSPDGPCSCQTCQRERVCDNGQRSERKVQESLPRRPHLHVCIALELIAALWQQVAHVRDGADACPQHVLEHLQALRLIGCCVLLAGLLLRCCLRHGAAAIVRSRQEMRKNMTVWNPTWDRIQSKVDSANVTTPYAKAIKSTCATALS